MVVKLNRGWRIFFGVLSLVSFLVALGSILIPFSSAIGFFFFGLIFLAIAIPKEAKKIPGIKWFIKKKKIWNKEEFQIKFFTFLTLKILVIFMIIAIWIKNYEFIYYDAILLPLVLFTYLIHKKIRLHLPIFILICIVFILHAAGGVIFIGGIRLYDMAFGFVRYDYITHFIGIFVTVFIVYNLVYQYHVLNEKRRSLLLLFLILVLMAAGVGTLIELIELVGVIFFDAGVGVGGYMNNAVDLFINLIGAIVGASIILIYHKKKLFEEIVMKGKISKLYTTK